MGQKHKGLARGVIKSQKSHLAMWVMIEQRLPLSYCRMHNICVALERVEPNSKRNAQGKVTYEKTQ